VNYLIDTNIISEIRKEARCDNNVAVWYATIDDDEVYLSVLVAGEIRKGIELARPRSCEGEGARTLAPGG
jgi:toxin FitB